MKPTRTLCLTLLFAGLGLAGCTLAPTYTRPELPTPASWPQGPAYAEPTVTAAVLPAWQEFYRDPQLRQVIALALANNRDLKVAVLNVEKYRATYQIERANLLPQLDATAGASHQRVAEDLSASDSAETRHQYSVGLGVSSYELDLFGRVRSLKDQALEEYLATDAARRSAELCLVAAVADSWLTLSADREQLELARQTVESRERSLELIRQRFNAGISADLDVQQARTTVETARVQQARYTRLVAQDQNLLTLLVGASVPDALLPGQLASEEQLLGSVAPGLTSEVLLARPDILQAEHRLIAANANIGAARAAFLPRITLTGSLGFGSDELSGLFRSGNGTWSFIPQLTVPLFDAGRNRAGLEVATTEREIRVAQYERAIQSAFREVADALATHGTIAGQLAAQQALVEASTIAHQHTEARYTKGIDSYLAVLDAERSLFAARQELIATRLARLNNQVLLYQALGGGATPAPTQNQP